MHWWQGAFTSSSKRHSDDDSVIIGDGASRYSVKSGFFSARRCRNLARSRKLRQVTKNDVEAWRSPSRCEHSSVRSASVLPQPLPLPELHVLLRNDPKFASSSVPLPSPNRRGVCEEKERERDRERQTAETSSSDAVDGLNGLKSRLVDQNTRTNLEQSETRSCRKSPQYQSAKVRSPYSYNINIPISAPTSPYSSPILSPPDSYMMATHYMTPPSVFQVWSAPELPYGNLGQSLYQTPFEKTASSVDNSPLQSPTVSSCLQAASSPRPASPIPIKISSETPMARRESNAQASVHPLPLPPGAGMPSPPTPISPVASRSDFSGASVPSQPTPISPLAAEQEFPGANIPPQPSPISPVAAKPKLKPIKSQWRKGKLIGRGTYGSVYVASNRDIKGANLLVDAYGVVKLADFGMAKHLNGEAANLSLKGSPYWLAPELLQSVMPKDASSDLALAVDIWSLGCTIIEMMNGKPPWSEYEGAAAMFKVLKETPPIPETLSADGKDFLQCCFRRNPVDRPTVSQLLDHPFVIYSQQPDACTQSLKMIRLTVGYALIVKVPHYCNWVMHYLNRKWKVLRPYR
ncbi:hypothetical protein DH2020_004137 [Rehmannia glutinosa]|uniref:Protein kinase domain-containing protein n=1 Tax=Rehmannia glutinosa TaxID=99300 RepID=A0ABR0XNZ8_REHGL